MCFILFAFKFPLILLLFLSLASFCYTIICVLLEVVFWHRYSFSREPTLTFVVLGNIRPIDYYRVFQLVARQRDRTTLGPGKGMIDG